MKPTAYPSGANDFRPGYCAIKDWVAALPKRPVVGAFTATATEKVKQDMMNLLGLQKERIFIGGFDRPNLYFRVVRTNRKPTLPWPTSSSIKKTAASSTRRRARK